MLHVTNCVKPLLHMDEYKFLIKAYVLRNAFNRYCIIFNNAMCLHYALSL
jgi:hypothetical protein